ncbi:unnamed protein product [Albugo candida]|uniref:Uncharacterized protein n=1 Tax=Albugo candida TaxID=65357 RepID=A0A024G4C0_9STRA|nr:unnamed protein product [Albugo candida]|eukprot:CCI41372.1 unnamed protein product [Albugo candida]
MIQSKSGSSHFRHLFYRGFGHKGDHYSASTASQLCPLIDSNEYKRINKIKLRERFRPSSINSWNAWSPIGLNKCNGISTITSQKNFGFYKFCTELMDLCVNRFSSLPLLRRPACYHCAAKRKAAGYGHDAAFSKVMGKISVASLRAARQQYDEQDFQGL